MGEQKCGTCRGQGGNGQKDKLPRKARWIKCRDCNGRGTK